MNHRVRVVSVFASGPDGGNPAPIVVDAAGMTDADMQQVARSHGHESGFVFPAPAGSGCDFEFRFWVPNHEMSMCGHATVGALWLCYSANANEAAVRIARSTPTTTREARALDAFSTTANTIATNPGQIR